MAKPNGGGSEEITVTPKHDSEDQPPESTRAVTEHFFIPLPEDTFYLPLDNAIRQSPVDLAALGRSFKRNLQGAMCTVASPFRVAVGNVCSRRFLQISIAEMIRVRVAGAMRRELTKEEELHANELAELRVNEEQESAEGVRRTLLGAFKDLGDAMGRELTKEEELHANESAKLKMKEEQESAEWVRRTVRNAFKDLGNMLFDRELALAMNEILRQGVVLVWGALEVLAQDLFVLLLNVNPKLVSDLIADDNTRRLSQLKAIPLETVAMYDYELSHKMGDILARSYKVDDGASMRTVFGVLFKGDERLQVALGERGLWMLNQLRHIIVHRRGIVDAEYIAKTGDGVELGTEIQIKPDDLERYFEFVTDAGIGMLHAAHTHVKSR